MMVLWVSKTLDFWCQHFMSFPSMSTLCLSFCLCGCLCILKMYHALWVSYPLDFWCQRFLPFPSMLTLCFCLRLCVCLCVCLFLLKSYDSIVGVLDIDVLVPAFPAFPINVNTSPLTRNLARVECFVSTLMADTSSNLLRHCFSLSHLFYFKLSLKSALSPFYFFPPLDHPMTTPKTILSSA